MQIKKLNYDLTVCKVSDFSDIDLNGEFIFVGKTDEEISLVLCTAEVPQKTVSREDGWKAFRIEGELDFSLVGILSGISSVLAENGIGIFAVSTFNTDYFLVKSENYDRALDLLSSAGYEIV